MKKVLYVTNIPVPYRVKFFNALSEVWDLTVLFERSRGENRDKAWCAGEDIRFRAEFLRGLPLGPENVLSFGILRWMFGRYDAVIFGCCNSPVQLLAMLAMRLFRKPYVLNLDGELFLSEPTLKNRLKRLLLSGAAGYLTAGTRAAEEIRSVAGDRPVLAYPFGSLTEEEVLRCREQANGPRDGTIAVVGRYYPYKGLDVALEAARQAKDLSFCFVGMGDRAETFQREQIIPENVQIIPYLQKEALEGLYARCAMVVLPSRQECWGLVIGEAAAFGTPIVSTWGSGAAAEYLGKAYPGCLAQPGDPESLLGCIRRLSREDPAAYRAFLLEKARMYTVENCVRAHVYLLEESL